MTDNLFAAFEQWQAVSSGRVKLRLQQDAGGLGAEYDFGSDGGFAVLRREVDWRLPEQFRLHLRLHGTGRPNRVEIKLVDGPDIANANVWWYTRSGVQWPATSSEWQIDSHEFAFAWGPAGGGIPTHIVAIEIAIVAEAGGAGHCWFETLTLEDVSATLSCQVQVFNVGSGNREWPGTDAWQASTEQDWWQQQWNSDVVISAVAIHWTPGQAATGFELVAQDELGEPQVMLQVNHAGAAEQFIYLGPSRIRTLRLQKLQGGNGIELHALVVVPLARARTRTEWLHEVARSAAPGLLPRYFSRQQVYWTVAGMPDCPTQALLNEDGVLETHNPGFSIEPQLQIAGCHYTWSNMTRTLALAQQRFPLPQVTLHADTIELQIQAITLQIEGQACALLCYRVKNGGHIAVPINLAAVVRPYQVTPPWQQHRDLGGEFPIHQLQWSGMQLMVNAHFTVTSLTPVTACELQRWLAPHPFLQKSSSANPPAKIEDVSGLAQAHLQWQFTLAPLQTQAFFLAVPIDPTAALPALADPAALFIQAEAKWQNIFSGQRLQGCAEVDYLQQVLQTATAHILVNRNGAALQPGPRRYARSWMRDGATMAAALLRTGQGAAVARFIEWYAPYLREDGSVPCCVDARGADPLVEHDSHGQWLYLVNEYLRFHPDTAFAHQLRPSLLRVVDFLATLRAQRCTQAFTQGEQQALYGLLPPSVSHEGYLAQPVHSYWDDFWAWRGLQSAAEFFHNLNDAEAARRCAHEARQLGDAIRQSMQRVIQQRALQYVPGSVEWADFDPTATACAVAQLGALELLPEAQLQASFTRFMQGWQNRVSTGYSTQKYSAYDIRMVSALLQLEQPAPAHALLQFLLHDMRPRRWQQWPEISWPDYRSPGHLGDLPHSWIGAEAVLAIRNLFVMEQDEKLVLGAGIKPEWLSDAGLSVTGWPTPFGVLNVALRQDASHCLHVALSGRVQPPGGLMLAPHLAAASAAVIDDPAGVCQCNDGRWRVTAAPAQFTLQLPLPPIHGN